MREKFASQVAREVCGVGTWNCAEVCQVPRETWPKPLRGKPCTWSSRAALAGVALAGATAISMRAQRMSHFPPQDMVCKCLLINQFTSK